MENIQDFREKKKYWVSFEDKKNDLAPYLRKVLEKLLPNKSDPSVKQEEVLLRAIIDEFQHDYDAIRERMEVHKKTYFSPLEEIYKMSGCFDELVEQLKSHPTIGTYETYMIKKKWFKQYKRSTRELKLAKDSSTPEKEIKEREDFLTSKCVEIDKALAEMNKLGPEIVELRHFLGLATYVLRFALELPDNKDGSSPSRKKFSSREDSSSGEGSASSSSRGSKRARK